MPSIEKIVNYYHSELKKSVVAKNYLKSRGFTKETIIKFQLGYAPSSPKIGKRFHDRIIFPVWDSFGEVIGWTARTLINADPKYVNVKGSAKFQKGRFLYGYYQAKRAIVKSRWAILVEGQTDVLTLHQYGLINTVAVSGTALKPAMVRLLSRYAQKVYIVLDADDAGEKASEKAQKLFEEENVRGILVKLPGKDDPDSYVYKYGKESFVSLLKQSDK